MARRKAPPARSVWAVLPVELRPDTVTIEQFVEPSERPPSYWHAPDRGWRELRAMRRWQDAVDSWGAENGIGRDELRAMGVRPTRPPGYTQSVGPVVDRPRPR